MRSWPADSAAVDDWVFDPTRMPAGIELSDDPLLHFRSEAYWESHRRRIAECKPALVPEQARQVAAIVALVGGALRSVCSTTQ